MSQVNIQCNRHRTHTRVFRTYFINLWLTANDMFRRLNNIDDANFSSWSDWEPCQSECDGVTFKVRECVIGENDCLSSTNFTMACNTEPCPGKS